MDISKMVQIEISKYMNTLGGHNPGGSQVKNDINLVQKGKETEHFFDGHYAFNIVPSMERDVWIIDYDASVHICSNPDLLTSTFELDKPARIRLPDGTSKSVSYGGTAQLNKDLVLTEVLYVPEFTHNLISIAQLTQQSGVRCLFYKSHCLFQREGNAAIVGIGKVKGNLHLFETMIERHFCNYFKPAEMSLMTWHILLGHPSITTMKHLKFFTDINEKSAQEAIRNCEVCLRAK